MFRLRNGVKVSEDIRGWGSTGLTGGFSPGLDDGRVESEMPGLNEAGRGYFSQSKGEAMWRNLMESVHLRGEDRRDWPVLAESRRGGVKELQPSPASPWECL